MRHLKPTAHTVHFGFYDATLSPVVEVESGEEIVVDTISANLDDDVPAEWLPPDVHDIYACAPRGTGPHILTGPIAVRGSEPGDVLQVGERRTSRNGNYYLLFQNDGNIVMYNKANAPLWSTATNGKPTNKFTMQTDGNLVAYQSDGAPNWSSGTGGNGNYFVVQDDGNLVVYKSDGMGVWASGTRGR